ncbi:MAG TPA: ATP-binding protein [Chthonomonadaceae bacterium]|nr:ATP-binding protein [Chthonomonadaceae bacterium]
MAVDQSVIRALATALEADTNNLPLRLHLAALLLEAGRANEALEHYAVVLARQPDHLEALSKAAQAAQTLGDTTRAEGYRRLHEALSWKQAKGLVDGIEDRPLPETPDGERNTRQPAIPPDDRPIPLSVGSFEDAEIEPFEEEEEKASPWEIERPGITLTDVAGMEEVKRRLNIAFLAPMKNPDMMRLYGKSLKGGLLLYGPPGCGKTYIARATAGELGARFLSVGLSDVLDMWLGQSEKNLHEIFQTARRHTPCVLFFDEIDALGRKRSLMRASAGRDVVNQLLAEMDSVKGNNEGVFILAATNHPWDVDTALRRPGRLDRTLLVLPPDAPAREAILRMSLVDRPIGPLDIPGIAAHTHHFSGADVAHLVESAAEFAMEDSIRQGRARPIQSQDFQRALREVRPSTRAWFDTARNYAQFANEGGAYDDLIQYLRANDML